MKLRAILSVVALCTAFHEFAAVDAAEQFALVIGNSAYQNAKLKNPVHDADALTTVLKKLSFNVATLKDIDIDRFDAGLRDFREQLTPNSVALFFFAGHGLQIDGVNYLLPLNHNIREKHEVRRKCVQVDTVLKLLDDSPCSMKILILDACRDNPFERSWSRNLSGRGLAAMEAPEGTVIAFSTAKGEVALDGAGNNAPYTERLVNILGNLPTEGQEIIDIFRAASRDVFQKTGQRPFLDFSAYSAEFYLKPPTEISNSGQLTIPESGQPNPAGGLTAKMLNNPSASSMDLFVDSPSDTTTKSNGKNPGTKITPYVLELQPNERRVLLDNRGGNSVYYQVISNSVLSLDSLKEPVELPPDKQAAFVTIAGFDISISVDRQRGKKKRFTVDSDMLLKVNSDIEDFSVETSELSPDDLRRWSSHIIRVDVASPSEGVKTFQQQMEELQNPRLFQALIANKSTNWPLHFRWRTELGTLPAILQPGKEVQIQATGVEIFVGDTSGWILFTPSDGANLLLEASANGTEWAIKKLPFDAPRFNKAPKPDA